MTGRDADDASAGPAEGARGTEDAAADPSGGTTRRGVLANLDVEARAAGATLPRNVQRRLSAAATLLRAFAEPGEPLWTPHPVDPERLYPAPGLPRPPLRSGHASRPEAPRVSWCAHGDPRVLSRRFDLAAADALDERLPGSAFVDGRDELLARLRADHAATPWVLKPALSAAGRGALRGRGERLADGTPVADAPAVAALFDAPTIDGARGALLEPWLDRLDDFGATAWVTDDGVEVLGLHRLLVTAGGGFRGVDLLAGRADEAPGLLAHEATRLLEVVRAVGARLAAAGCTGPFGVDAFAWLDASGARRFRALGEVNARLGFGAVARALVSRVVAVETGRWTLHLARGPVPTEADVPLLAPGGPQEDDTSAWLEVVREA